MKVAAAWVLWLITNMAFLLSTRNPIYLLVSIVLLLSLGQSLARKQGQSAWLAQNVRFLATMVLISTLINSLFTHIGQTVLFSLPEHWLLIGGNITLESVVYGVINGLVIAGLYLLFNIFNLALSIRQITGLIPRTFHAIAMIVTIALTFFPSIQQRAREIKEAQMIRGNPMKKVADWLPILMPLLVTSLEKAFLLSESMTTRGFHTHTDSNHARLSLAGLILAAFMVFAGWILRLYDYPLIISLLLYAFGAGLLILVFASARQRNQITRLHQEKWQKVDKTLVIILSLSLLFLTIYLLGGYESALTYTPYPRLNPPGFTLVETALALLAGLPLLGQPHD